MAETTKDKVKREKQRLAAAIPEDARLPASLLDKLTGPADVSNVPVECGLLSERQLEITSWDAIEVRDRIAAQQATAVEVVGAFARRAAIAHQLTCCLCDLFVDEAVARARELYEYQQQNGKTSGPLHGVPISLKDHLALAGRTSPAAFASWIDSVPKRDAGIVQLLRSAGAVFFVKTCQPQTGMHVETHNFLGRCLNPFNTGLSPGGSSGGEGALIAMKGSCLGVGSDIGGSIRIPAGNCGLWGFKPTGNLLPLAGVRTPSPSPKPISLAVGPLATSRRDLALFLASVFSSRPHLHDFSLVPPPAQLSSFDVIDIPPQLEGGRRLRVGVMHDDGVVRPHPPVARAMKWMEDRLQRRQDVELVAYRPFNHGTAQQLLIDLLGGDGGEINRKALGDEEMTPLTARAMRSMGKPLALPEYDQRLGDQERYKAAYARHWVSSGIDVLLSPYAHHAAPPHDTSGYIAYTGQWNVLAYPAAVFPLPLRVDPRKDQAPTAYEPLNRLDAKLQKLYKPEDFANAPLGLQLVARPFDDALLMSSLAVIEAALA